MNDEQPAARFESDLSAFLAGHEPPPGADLAALRIARRLTGMDLSGESSVRLSLRARLLAAGRPRAWGLTLSARLALAATGMLLLCLLPLRLTRSPIPRPSPPLAPPPATVPAPRGPGAEPLFHAIPAKSLFVAHGPADRLFVTARGRPIDSPSSRTVIWELDDSTFILEQRPVSLDDLFVTPNL